MCCWLSSHVSSAATRHTVMISVDQCAAQSLTWRRQCLLLLLLCSPPQPEDFSACGLSTMQFTIPPPFCLLNSSEVEFQFHHVVNLVASRRRLTPLLPESTAFDVCHGGLRLNPSDTEPTFSACCVRHLCKRQRQPLERCLDLPHSTCSHTANLASLWCFPRSRPRSVVHLLPPKLVFFSFLHLRRSSEKWNINLSVVWIMLCLLRAEPNQTVLA